jgi:hypothetical protein
LFFGKEVNVEVRGVMNDSLLAYHQGIDDGINLNSGYDNQREGLSQRED